MYDHSGDEPQPKSTDDIVQEVKDTDGFVEAVLIYQQEGAGKPDARDDPHILGKNIAEGEPKDFQRKAPPQRFALELIDIVSMRKKIEIETELERNLLADQLRVQL